MLPEDEPEDEPGDEGLELAPPAEEPDDEGLEVAPPPAWSFFSIELDEELEGDEGDVLEDEELEGEVLEGLDGVVAPADDAPDGELDEGLVLELGVDDEPLPLLPFLSHAVSRVAPSAMETATAMVESLIWPPGWGTSDGARIEPGNPLLQQLIVMHVRCRG